MKWSDQAWEQVKAVYAQIIAMPFNEELSKGTLHPDKFVFYLAQDAFYLLEFGKALSAISSRLRSADQVLAFANFSSGAILAERALHESYFEELGLPHEVKPSPTTLLYTNYLLNQVAYEQVEVAVAAVLPCFWIYKKVGDHIFSMQAENENPYQRWIDMYAGEAFAKSVKLAIDIADELAEKAGERTQKNMLAAFEQATKLEWMFWDGAYRIEKWKI